MENKREERRSNLRQRLIEAAEARIAAAGLQGLKARDVTQDAGCALGALYTAVEDLDMLVLHVNSRTLRRLGQALAEASPPDLPPGPALAALAQGYVAFAVANFRLWSALFGHTLREGVATPDWHLADQAVLIERIVGPLAALRPDLSGEALVLRARTLFAAVHGVVQLGLQERFVGAPPDRVAAEVAALVEALARGLPAPD